MTGLDQPPRMVSGPVGPRLLRMTLPMIAGLLANMLFNLVDTFYIARLGDRPLAAMSFTFPIVFFVTGTAMGMSIGTSSVISRAIGQGDSRNVRRLGTDSLVLALLLVISLVVIGLLFMDEVFLQMGAAPDLIPMIRAYMVPWFCGVGFLVVPMVGNSAIRATGDTLTPSLLMLAAGVLNVALDPFLIFGIGPFPRMELAGAALATVISYVVVCVASLTLLKRRYKLISFERHPLSGVWRSWKRILYVALPAVITNQLVPVAVGILTRMVSGYGEQAVAAWGVSSRIESLMMSPCFALSTVMAPFTGQNFGAGRLDRVKEALRFAVRYCFGIGVVLWVLVGLSSRWVALAFTREPLIIQQIQLYLWIVPLSYGAFGLMLQITATFNGNNRPLEAFVVFISRLFLFIVPLAMLGRAHAGLGGMFAGVGLANFAACGLAWMLIQVFLAGPDREGSGG